MTDTPSPVLTVEELREIEVWADSGPGAIVVGNLLRKLIAAARKGVEAVDVDPLVYRDGLPLCRNDGTQLRESELASVKTVGVEDSDLVRRLKAIRDNDWRFSMLAYTSDTAGEAAEALKRMADDLDRGDDLT